ncbi:N-acetylmuramoyl-L-alanine amidase [Pseudomonas akapageensis]|uniref:N-acetylmuramoyl-L-alanine amidase n=1 Tax=Pseudomonas akapageensis TaxID=2609961 RepID=UPI0014094B2D|nr:N-acetylmuramoyl-L-alanine amidase [Pseudomonas akapageensis]
MSSLFDDLAGRYKTLNIAFPALKPVTLAQWILESGRGTSDLATQHLNFGGLKWRSEMVGFATSVAYQAHDGLDFYCKFASLDAFILGYWKFLSRSPYKGWEVHAAVSPEDFIRFIGHIYTPAAGYADQVLALVGEATERLGDALSVAQPQTPEVAGAPVMIVIDPGHGGLVKTGGSSPNNANSPSGEQEKNWTLDFAKRTRTAVLTKALASGKNVKVELTRETDINLGLNARAAVAKAKGAKFFLSIHLNGFDKKVRGVEALINNVNVNKDEDRAFAQVIHDNVVAAMHRIDPTTLEMPNFPRRVKEQSLGVLSDIALGNTTASHPCRACLVELEFMDVPAVDALFRLNPPQATTAEKTAQNRQEIADALADALLSQV